MNYNDPEIIEQAINSFEKEYKFELTYFDEESTWKQDLSKLLLEIWYDGYATGFSDQKRTGL